MSRLYNRGCYGSCCVVPHCSMRSGTNSLSEVKAFRLPRCDERRAAWLKAMNRQDWYSGYTSVICSRHFVKGCPSRDPNDPDYIPSIFPPASVQKTEKWKPMPRKRMIQKGNEKNQDKPGASKKKTKVEPKEPEDTESTCTDKNAEANNADVPGDRVPPIPEQELVLVGRRTLDVNYFVECLRRMNKHHAAMQCSISDMIICEEQAKGRQRGIAFRCKVCLFSNTIWLEDSIEKEAITAIGQANKNAPDDQIPLPKLPIPRKPGGSLPVQSQSPVIVQSHVPLFGLPQVAPMQQTLSSDGASSSFTDPPLVEMKFCVEEQEQPAEQENTSGKWTPLAKRSRSSPRIALTPRMISKRHAEYLSSKSAATQSKRPSSAPSQLSNSDSGRITSIPNSLPGASILQTHLEGTGTADPKRIVLAPGDLQNISSLFQFLPGQGTTTTSAPQRILVPQIQSVQSMAETSGASRSILLPSVASSSQSTSVQSVRSVPETITPDISTTNVLPVNLNLVKKEKSETETFQPTRTLSPAGGSAVDLNLVKKEVEYSEYCEES